MPHRTLVNVILSSQASFSQQQQQQQSDESSAYYALPSFIYVASEGMWSAYNASKAVACL
jgi:hypothetical protein